ncbi:MAG: RNA polymerase sigma factor [bacterium]
MTDRELVQGILEKDQAAFRELVEKHQQNVIRTCYSLVQNLEDAEDLAQDVFIEILHSAGFFRGEAKLSSWVYRIAVNKSLNYLKKQKRKPFFSLFAPAETGKINTTHELHMAERNMEADGPLEEEELRKALHYAIDRLPVNQKIAFTLHKYEELSYKEISNVMHASLSSVESLMHRAKQNLQKQLSHYYHEK